MNARSNQPTLSATGVTLTQAVRVLARVQSQPRQTSGDRLSLNYGTLYPALLKLEQEGYLASEWGISENNRKAKYYRLTRAGKKRVGAAAQEWERTTAILARFLSPEQSS